MSKLPSTEIDSFQSLVDTNLQLAEDALLLLSWAKKTGLIQKARSGMVAYGSPDFRAYTGLYALADMLFLQAEPGDSKAFDLYDALAEALPEKAVRVPDQFLVHYKAWREHEEYVTWRAQVTPDLGAHRRVSEFVKSCA